MLLLFSLAIYKALKRTKADLQENEHLFAFLDDVYALCEPERVRTVYDSLSRHLFEVAGIRLHAGKTRVWNKAGEAPQGMDDLGPGVWSPDGVKVLGVSIGSASFVKSQLDERLLEEQRLWEGIPYIRDAQCAWQVVVQCATPMANHVLRTVPPSQVELSEYAEVHDQGVWWAACAAIGGLPLGGEEGAARQVASLPSRLGGLGLRSATRTSPAASTTP